MKPKYPEDLVGARGVFIGRLPFGLHGAEAMSNILGGLFTKERLLDLATAKFIPHWVIDDGEPLFNEKDVKQWIRESAFQSPGKPIQTTVNIVGGSRAVGLPRINDLPPSLRGARDRLRRFLVPSVGPCVYFLCDGKEVVYVGQSVSLAARIENHLVDKAGKFTSIYFLQVEEQDMTRVETALIKVLSPRLNGTWRGSQPSAEERKLADETLEAACVQGDNPGDIRS